MASGSSSWQLTYGAVTIALVGGVAAGFVVGQRSSKSNSSPEVAEVKTADQVAAQQVKSLNDQLQKATRELAREKARAEAAVRDRDAKVAELKKAKPTEPRTPAVADTTDQNDLVLGFIDNPAGYTGRELTARVRYGDRDRYASMALTLQERTMAGWGKDDDGNDLVPFFGQSVAGSRARIDLRIGIPKNLNTPNAAPGDEVLVTFKCGSHPKDGNVAVRITRPMR